MSIHWQFLLYFMVLLKFSLNCSIKVSFFFSSGECDQISKVVHRVMGSHGKILLRCWVMGMYFISECTVHMYQLRLREISLRLLLQHCFTDLDNVSASWFRITLFIITENSLSERSLLLYRLAHDWDSWCYWTPRLGRKGPIKQGPSVRRSFCLFVSFLRTGSLIFPETQHGVRGPYLVMCKIAGFFGKNPHRAKLTENDKKCPKNMVFGLFRKTTLSVLSGICVK